MKWILAFQRGSEAFVYRYLTNMKFSRLRFLDMAQWKEQGML